MIPLLALFIVVSVTFAVLGLIKAMADIGIYLFIDRYEKIDIVNILLCIVFILMAYIGINQFHKIELQRLQSQIELWNNGLCINDNTKMQFVGGIGNYNLTYVMYECPECGRIIKLKDYDNQAWSTVHN